MTKMNPEIKAQWVAALLSGEYEQGTGSLRSTWTTFNYEKNVEEDITGFCCLGVLCNLHAKAHPEIAAKETDPTRYMNHIAFPPKEVYEWAGLAYEEVGGELIPSKLVTIQGDKESLDVHNDKGSTFKQIATAIKRSL